MNLRDRIKFPLQIRGMLKTFWDDKSNRVSFLLMVSLVLFICHYQVSALKYVPLFQIGGFLLIFIIGHLILSHWQEFRRIGLGPAYIWIPLAVISGSAVARIFIQHDAQTLAGAIFMVSMFGLYVVSRKYGEKALSFFMPIVIIGVISIVIQFFVNGQPKNPGLFSNYAVAAQFLVFGWLVSPQKHQWWLSAVVIAGLLLSGAEEGLFYIAILGAVVLIRRDWGRRILLPVGVVALILISGLITGHVQDSRAVSMIKDTYRAITDKTLTQEERDTLLNEATNGRWLHGWRLHRPIQPLGYGVTLTYHYENTPHNIVLLIIDQLGPAAMIAWFAAVIGGIRKTKWKYGLLSLILFGMFQPFVWTMMAPYMWAMVGSATMAKGTSYIFKECYA